MEGNYLRVSQEELERAIDDPSGFYDDAQDLIDEQEEADLPPERARHLSTHKAWHAIAFLLGRAEFHVDVVHGEGEIAEDEDWGYGPPRHLSAERVEAAAEALAGIDFDDLVDGVDPSELTEADVYPLLWDDEDAFEWVRHWFTPLPTFFSAAAENGDAIIVWIG
ncbi:YfbM family protein [Allokutzneria sp. A3M-2-11 16]|uniref:YfbM family protein n=1 Tax=Allokutzneria sp. A3M-2-11 16 TaxID=2962043 RepID=UPI0020B8008F|nr:YfbM family protein [Allokutzneria sp. A3M-2-11 16]MCP3801887.1 YfbM family protein [Allokutzneria sp. A3M-2-11 16]